MRGRTEEWEVSNSPKEAEVTKGRRSTGREKKNTHKSSKRRIPGGTKKRDQIQKRREERVKRHKITNVDPHCRKTQGERIQEKKER